MRVSRVGEAIRFAVRDSGIGIPEDRRARLFQAFSQVDASTTRRFGGTGLGLAICRRLVELLGGEIGVESEVGRGSEFHFTIAYVPGVERAEPQATWLAGKVAVVADRSPAVREAVAQQLRPWGMTSRCFEALDEALAAARQRPADLLLVDAALIADPHALEAAGEPPFVVMASLHRLGEAKRLTTAAGLVSKPIKRSQLFEALQQVFQGVPQRPRAAAELPDDRPLGEVLPARILLVEDSPINQKVAIRLLDRLGYRADIACDGAEAVSVVERIAYDVVLMDIQMPVLDGLDATREIRRRALAWPQPWIVAMTAEAISGDEARCRAAGMDDYVTKPVQLATLAAALRRGLLARREGKERGEEAPAAPDDSLTAFTGEIASELGEDFVQELLREFLGKLAGYRASVLDACSRHDAPALARIAHTMVGEAGSVGAAALASACAELQVTARTGKACEPATEGVLNALDALEPRLRAILPPHRQTPAAST
ncbi:MAG: response regulator [Myxococcales bacterium]|nr:response regulator [Myxococcales bacterium]